MAYSITYVTGLHIRFHNLTSWRCNKVNNIILFIPKNYVGLKYLVFIGIVIYNLLSDMLTGVLKGLHYAGTS